MKSEIKDLGRDYPCLKISTKTKSIILFTSKRAGVIVHKGDGGNELGQFSDIWEEDCFTFYNGLVKLEN